MTTRKAPRAFRLTDELQVAGKHQPAQQLAIGDDLQRAIAGYIHSLRQHAELIAIAEKYGQPIETTDEDMLDLEALDRLVDPMGGTEQRLPLFHWLLAAPAAHEHIAELDRQLIHDERWLRQLYDETCGWGEHVQALLDDETITAVTISGTTITAEGSYGRIVRPGTYANAREPLRRAEFLVLAAGIDWNGSSPTATLLLRSGTRILLMREPQIRPSRRDEPRFLVVIERGRAQPSTLGRLVEQEILDRPTAERSPQGQAGPVADAAGEGSEQPVRLGWLDAALAYNRERARLRQASQEATE